MTLPGTRKTGAVDVAARHRWPLLGLAAALYALNTLAFATVEQPGLGLGHFYYLPIALVAIVLGPYAGAAAGVLAVGLYEVGVVVNHDIPTRVQVEQSLIRLTTFVLVGALVGTFARVNRTLMEELSQLAQRDSLTGLPNTRAFEAAIAARLARRARFAILVGDVDELRRLNGGGRREGGDDALRRLADRLVARGKQNEDVARIGGDEFAILTDTVSDGGRALAVQLESQLASSAATITFGWAVYPDDGDNALALYRVADERLYARKVARGYRRGFTQSGAVEVSRN